MSDRRLILGAIALAVLDGHTDSRFGPCLREVEQIARDVQAGWVAARASPPEDVLLIASMVFQLADAARRRDDHAGFAAFRYLREALGGYAHARLKGGGA